MNAFVGGFWDGTWWSQVEDCRRIWRTYRKIEEFDQPSMRWVFVDEFPLLNDGHLVHLLPTTSTRLPLDGSMNDCPASYHAGSGALSYADGHSEIHQWKGSKIKAPVSYGKKTLALNVPAGDSVNDIKWWSQNTTVK